MNENNNYVNLTEPMEPPRSWRDYAAPVLALGLSILFWAVFSFDGLIDTFPGLGVPVFVLAYFAAVFLMVGARWDTGGVFLAAVSVCLALCCTLYAYEGFTILNCFLILLTAAMATFRLSGQAGSAPLSLRAVPETVELSIFALFSRIAPPWKRLMPRREDAEKTTRIAIAALVSVGLLAVVLALLASADMVFGGFFQSIGDWFRRHSFASLLWKLIRTGALTMFLLSGLYFIRTEPRQTPKTRPARDTQVLYFLLPSVLLDAVYVIFCAVQLRYLFGGAEAAAMAGGWSEYARTGFFQLVAVAAINLTLCAAGTDEERLAKKGGAALRIAEAVMLLLTVVILLSAARRMQLYVLAFGMSILRLMTIWGMAAAAVGIVLCAWKLFRPRASFFPVFFGYALVSWCILCLINPAGQVAKYNVNAYLDGRLKTVDTDYLGELYPDAKKALTLLEESSDEYDADIRRIRFEWDREPRRWAGWTASRASK